MAKRKRGIKRDGNYTEYIDRINGKIRRGRGGPSGDQIKTLASCEPLRKNSSLLGVASKNAALFRKAMLPVSSGKTDDLYNRRTVSVFQQIEREAMREEEKQMQEMLRGMQDAGEKMQDGGWKMQDVGYMMQDAGGKRQDGVYKMQGAGEKRQDAGYKLTVANTGGSEKIERNYRLLNGFRFNVKATGFSLQITDRVYSNSKGLTVTLELIFSSTRMPKKVFCIIKGLLRSIEFDEGCFDTGEYVETRLDAPENYVRYKIEMQFKQPIGPGACFMGFSLRLHNVLNNKIEDNWEGTLYGGMVQHVMQS